MKERCPVSGEDNHRSRIRFTPSMAALVIALLATPGPSRAENPCIAEEPEDYRTSDFLAPVPCTLTGTRVIATPELEHLLRNDHPLLVDVFPAPRRPANLTDDHLWFSPTRETLPGSAWLPNTGFGVLPEVEEQYFRFHLERLTGGDRKQPVVFFCMTDCWMSWNAARRARRWGYSSVLWYPDGTDGWKRAGHDLVTAEPVRPRNPRCFRPDTLERPPSDPSCPPGEGAR